MNAYSGGLPGGASGKQKLPANAEGIRDMGLIPGLGRCPGEGHGHPFRYSFLEEPVDRGAWWATVHGGGGGLAKFRHN